jgi:hypothetical protein
MTETEYYQLLDWFKIKKNRASPEYAEMYKLKKQAVYIRAQITACKVRIKNCMFYLEGSKTDEAVKKFTDKVNNEKDIKAKLLNEFKALKSTIYGS